MSTLEKIKSYTPPTLHCGRETYISFNAYDPAEGRMKRKRIKLNAIEPKQRKKYANDLIKRLTEKLIMGWNPWIEKENGTAYMLFRDCCEKYRQYIDKLLKDGAYRYETHKSLASYLKNMMDWNEKRLIPITYIYQFDKDFCVQFLDEIYINRDNTAFTHDNYLGFLRQFGHWCCQKNFLKTVPTEGLSVLGRGAKKKKRKTIEPHHLNMIHDYLEQKNKHFLLASYILYYCFIRPAEMARLKIGNINLAKQTIYIEDTISKNKKDGTITLPVKVIHLMLDLNIFSSPSNYYLFSEGFIPGKKKVSEKIFRDYWARYVRKDLNLPDTYKFYSLKDTGITDMLRHQDVLSVRDQARHSSILMTDTYTPHDIQKANEIIKSYEGDF